MLLLWLEKFCILIAWHYRKNRNTYGMSVLRANRRYWYVFLVCLSNGWNWFSTVSIVHWHIIDKDLTMKKISTNTSFQRINHYDSKPIDSNNFTCLNFQICSTKQLGNMESGPWVPQTLMLIFSHYMFIGCILGLYFLCVNNCYISSFEFVFMFR